MADWDPISGLQRRVAGMHDVRLDGMTDLVMRARGCTVLDIGCNRGHVGWEFAQNGARVVHGCDYYVEGVDVARHNFADLRMCEGKFEVVDLRDGPDALIEAFGPEGYDIVLYLGTHHKLQRPAPKNERPAMTDGELFELVRHLGNRANHFFAWRGPHSELEWFDRVLGKAGLRRIHFSEISDLGPCAIWQRYKPQKKTVPEAVLAVTQSEPKA